VGGCVVVVVLSVVLEVVDVDAEVVVVSSGSSTSSSSPSRLTASEASDGCEVFTPMCAAARDVCAWSRPEIVPAAAAPAEQSVTAMTAAATLVFSLTLNIKTPPEDDGLEGRRPHRMTNDAAGV
jgi:hypothetical protein